MNIEESTGKITLNFNNLNNKPMELTINFLLDYSTLIIAVMAGIGTWYFINKANNKAELKENEIIKKMYNNKK